MSWVKVASSEFHTGQMKAQNSVNSIKIDLKLFQDWQLPYFAKSRSKQNAHCAKNNAIICPKIDPLPLTSINESL